MKKLLVASAVTLLLGSAAAASAQGWDNAWDNTYVSVLGGPTFAPGLNVNGTKQNMDTGYNVGARLGYNLDSYNLPHFSIEADGLFNESTYKGNNAGRLQSSSYMGNLIYHVPTGSPFSLYGGAGIGLVHTNYDGNAGIHGGSDVLGWQALGGVEYRASEDASLFVEYRHQNAHNFNIGGLTNIGNTSDNMSVGVKWHM